MSFPMFLKNKEAAAFDVETVKVVLQLLISLAIALVTGRLMHLRGKQPVVNYLRGILLGTASLCFFTAVKYMSVATAISSPSPASEIRREL